MVIWYLTYAYQYTKYAPAQENAIIETYIEIFYIIACITTDRLCPLRQQ